MIRRGPFTALLVAALVAGCAASGESAEYVERPHVTLALEHSVDSAELTTRAALLDATLERALARQGQPLDVRITFPADREALLQGLATGAIDAAVVDPWTASIAQRSVNANVALAADRVLSTDGTPIATGFHSSSYVVLEDSPYSSLKALRGKRVVYPMEDPLAGYLYPVSELVRQQLVPPAGATPADPRVFFGEVLYAPTYAEAHRALLEGRADVAISATTMPAALEGEMRESTRAVATQGPLPGDAIVYAPDFRGAAERAFTGALLALEDDEAAAMQPFVSGRFAGWREASSREHLNGLQIALVQTGLRLEH